MKNKLLFFSLTLIALVVFSLVVTAQEPVKIGIVSPKVVTMLIMVKWKE